MSNRKYAIVDAISFQQVANEGLLDVGLLFEKILETNLNTLRYNNDRTKFIIKSSNSYDIDYLRNRSIELNINYTEYTYEEMLQEVKNPEWNDDMLYSSSSSSSGI